MGNSKSDIKPHLIDPELQEHGWIEEPEKRVRTAEIDDGTTRPKPPKSVIWAKSVEVKTKRELSKAICDKEAEILIYNKKLAQKVRRFKKIRNVTTAGSMLGCALSCGEILLFVTLIFIGVADLYSIYTDYSIVIVTKHPKYGDQTVILRRI